MVEESKAEFRVRDVQYCIRPELFFARFPLPLYLKRGYCNRVTVITNTA